jgi:hypothetical protein
MKITTDGGEFELVPRYDDVYKEDIYVLKPIEPKTEKNLVRILISQSDVPGVTKHLYENTISATPTTANKLSEAISALVEYVTNKNQSWDYDTKIEEARKSFQESQK